MGGDGLGCIGFFIIMLGGFAVLRVGIGTLEMLIRGPERNDMLGEVFVCVEVRLGPRLIRGAALGRLGEVRKLDDALG